MSLESSRHNAGASNSSGVGSTKGGWLGYDEGMFSRRSQTKRQSQTKVKGSKMALFNEQKIENGSSLEQMVLKDIPKGKSVMFYIAGFAEKTSTEYGDFKVAEGLRLDLDAASIDALVSSGVGSSFIPNTMLLNMIEEGRLQAGKVYRIEKAWDRDDKFAGNKRAKGYGYNVFEMGVDKDTLAALRNAFMEAKSATAEKEL